MHKSWKRLRRVALPLLLGVALTAQAAPADDYFQQGMQAFKAGDYQTAVKNFRQARTAGMDKVALYYNLGVSYYRLGQYQRAEENFRQTLRYPQMAPLGYYNLGLVALKRKQNDAARQWFQKSADSSEDPKLTALANNMLQRLGAAPAELSRTWNGIVSFSTGYDDNVNVTVDSTTDQITGEGDTYTELFATTSKLISGDYRDGVLFTANAFTVNYGEFDEYNLGQLRAGISKKQPLGSWRTDVGVHGDYLLLGGSPYQTIAGLELNATSPAVAGAEWRLRYRYDSISSLDNDYDYLAGSRQQMRVERAIKTDKAQRRLLYELELNDREDTDTASYSPTRHTVRGLYRGQLGGGWHWEGDISYRLSSYPEVVGVSREDVRLKAGLGLIYDINDRWQTAAQYSYTDNQSDVDEYDYQRGLYSVNISWLY